MKKEFKNYVFIDSQNVNLSIRQQGWVLDFKRFRVYLEEKYGVQKAFLFLGYMPENKGMYTALESYGYVIVFKPVLRKFPDSIKGNVDADLVFQAMIEYNNYDKAVIVTGDGDFYCLVKYLSEQEKLRRLIVPNRYKYSILLRRALSHAGIAFMNDLRKRLEYGRE